MVEAPRATKTNLGQWWNYHDELTRWTEGEKITRVQFSELFTDNGNGSYSPNGAIRIGGITLGAGVSFSPGVSFSGVDIAKYAGHDLEIERDAEGTVDIKGVF